MTFPILASKLSGVERGTLPQTVLPSLDDLLEMSPHELRAVDIAAMNLACAVELPGSESVDNRSCLATLEQWTATIARYTRNCLPDYDADPAYCHHHPGFFRFLCIVTMLKHPNGLRCGYQPTAIGNFDFIDARDDFISGLLTRQLGTCSSFPVLCVAVGRRLGYPMHVAVAHGHVLCQWINDDGTHANLECSGYGGGEMYPDSHYHDWPHPPPPQLLATGRYLRPLEPHEELSLFLATRGHVLVDHHRYAEAEEVFHHCLRITPDFTLAGYALQDLNERRYRNAVRQSFSSTFIAAPPPEVTWQVTYLGA